LKQTGWIGSLVLACLGACASCKSKEPRPSPAVPSASVTPPVPSATLAPSAAGPAESAPKPVRDLPRCKALDKSRLVSLGSRATDAVGLEAREGSLYFLTFARERVKTAVVRFPRDGAKPIQLGGYQGPGLPRCFVLAESAALVCVGRALVSIPLAGGEASKLAAGFSDIAAPSSTHAYGVRCDKKGGIDQLVRVKLTGGEVEVAASWPRNKGNSCDYKAIALDDTHAYVAQWEGGQRLVALSLADGAMRELATDKGFAGRLAVEPDAIVANVPGGIFRVPKIGGAPRHLTKLGAAPFSEFAWDPAALYVLETEAYSMDHFIAKVPIEGGKEQRIETLAVQDSLTGSEAMAITVDDQCLYFARKREDERFEILARPK
jgi:hypothetical protein